MKVSKIYLVKKEIEKILKNSDCVNLSDREKDPTHSKLTLQWVLKLKSDADEALQIAALGHDIDRAVEKRRVKKENFEDYEEYKREHAKESAKIVCEILEKHGFKKDFIKKVRFLIENHEVGGSKEADTLKEADSLTFFSFDIYHYLKDRGNDKTKKKIRFMYKRLSEEAKKLVNQIKFKDKKIENLFKEATLSL